MLKIANLGVAKKKWENSQLRNQFGKARWGKRLPFGEKSDGDCGGGGEEVGFWFPFFFFDFDFLILLFSLSKQTKTKSSSR